MMKKIFHLNTIRRKFLIYFSVTLIIIITINIYTLYLSKVFMTQMESMFNNSSILNELSTTVTKVHTNLWDYITTKQSDSLNNYAKYSDKLGELRKTIDTQLTYDKYQLALRNIGFMIDSYLNESFNAIQAKRGRNTDQYLNSYNKASNIEKNIQNNIDKLNLSYLDNNTERYQIIKDNLNILQQLNILMIIEVIILSFLIIYRTTYKMTEPIIRLSHSAEEISKGNFETDEVIVATEDEVKVMAVAFNKMKNNLKNYIEELKNKAEMETKLLDQEMKNLKMQNLLDTAELQALQSQINPHFLFNSLNAATQLAMIEGADRTSQFVENMSALFRYNIKKLNNQVTLKEEIENVTSYAELLKVRFGDLIHFSINVDNRFCHLPMPPLILQPIVENACIHGIGDLEEGGTVKIAARGEKDKALVIIEDNGVGMEDETIKKAFFNSNQASVPRKAKKGHTTGIGMSNVIHRLKLFYGVEDVVEIISKKNMGTRFIIKIPMQGVSKHVQDPNR